MDLISILATVILVTTVGTVLTGVLAYAAFRLREKRRPQKNDATNPTPALDNQEPIFLTRYVLNQETTTELEASSPV